MCKWWKLELLPKFVFFVFIVTLCAVSKIDIYLEVVSNKTSAGPKHKS